LLDALLKTNARHGFALRIHSQGAGVKDSAAGYGRRGARNCTHTTLTLRDSQRIRIANARIRFANGCVANTTASRVSFKTERKLKIFESAAYMSVDLQQKILTLIRKRNEPPQPGQLPVSIEEANLEQGDALKSEIESFLDCIRNDRRPIVSGEDGLRALETAIRITEQVHANLPGRRTPA